MELLRGLMDTDGSVSTKDGTITFVTTSEQLSKDFYFLCRSLGINLKKKEFTPKLYGKECGKGWKFTLYTELPIFKLTRKLNNIRKGIKGKQFKINYTSIRNIELGDSAESTCIMVDNDSKLFLTTNFTTTHNSVYESSYISHRATFFKGTQNVIAGLNDPDIKVITDLVDEALINLPIAFKQGRVEDNWKRQVTLGEKTPSGERFPWSSIPIRNLDGGKNTEALAGLSPFSMVIDEIGKGDWLKAFSAAIPGFATPYGWRCSPLAFGTSGDMEKAQDAKKVFDSPEAYNFLAVEVPDEPSKKTSVFISGHYAHDFPKDDMPLSAYLKTSNTPNLSKINIKVTNFERAESMINEERDQARKSDDSSALLKLTMYHPKNRSELFLTDSNNNFPVEAAKALKEKLLQNYDPVCVDFYRELDGKPNWKYSDLKPIMNYPVKPSDDKLAPCVMYEPPIKTLPYGTYILGCLPPGEKVLTESGLKNVEDVQLSDKLINKDGDYVKIKNLQKYSVNNEEIYDIKLSNTFRTTKFTGEHPILISEDKVKYINSKKAKLLGLNQRTKDFKFSFVETKKIKEGQWVQIPNIYKKEINDYSVFWEKYQIRNDFIISNPLYEKDFWWLVGYFLGDGWVNEKNNTITFAINKAESHYEDKIKQIVNSIFNRQCSVVNKHKNCIELSFCSKVFSKFLVDNFKKHALNKTIPEWVKFIHKEYKTQLVLGYLDSDGRVWTSNESYYVDFVSISLNLLEGIQDILFSLNITSSLKKLRSAKKSIICDRNVLTRDTYQLSLCPHSTVAFKSLFTCFLDSKLNKITSPKKLRKKPQSSCFISKCGNFIYFKIKKIAKSKYTGFVYNFECDTHTYLCHHITTHNCDPFEEDSSSDKINSLGSFYVFKRMHSPFEPYQDSIVLSYAGRPKTVSEFNELVLMVTEYYGAIALPENENKTLIQHFFAKQKAHLLADTLQLAKVISPTSRTERTKGLAATTPNQRYGMSRAYQYTKEEIEATDEFGNMCSSLGINRIPDPMLLEEMIQYRGKTSASRGIHDINCDRIVALYHALILKYYYDQEFPLEFTTKKEEDENKPKKKYVPQNVAFTGKSKNQYRTPPTWLARK